MAGRLGSIEELGAGTEGEPQMAAGPAAVFGALLQVVVNEPEVLGGPLARAAGLGSWCGRTSPARGART